VCPLPPVSGGRGTLAGEKGVGRVPIPTRGIHCGTLYMYVLCAYYLKVGASEGTREGAEQLLNQLAEFALVINIVLLPPVLFIEYTVH
jgi:hypothetical protein